MNINISEAKECIFILPNGTRKMNFVFKTDEEKERASKIVEQLRGMTIDESRRFLLKVSDAFTKAIEID